MSSTAIKQHLKFLSGLNLETFVCIYTVKDQTPSFIAQLGSPKAVLEAVGAMRAAEHVLITGHVQNIDVRRNKGDLQ